MFNSELLDHLVDLLSAVLVLLFQIFEYLLSDFEFLDVDFDILDMQIVILRKVFDFVRNEESVSFGQVIHQVENFIKLQRKESLLVILEKLENDFEESFVAFTDKYVPNVQYCVGRASVLIHIPKHSDQPRSDKVLHINTFNLEMFC